MEIVKVKNLDEKTLQQMLSVWEPAMRAAHKFLADSDIVFLKSLVEDGIPLIHKLAYLNDDGGTMQAFVGVTDGKVEMLYVNPLLRGKGYGRHLLSYAIKELGADSVDVNENDPEAVGFYENMGFRVLKRSPLDDRGRPFPMLHMHIK